jgi:putative nucleotidyltransferase with HDIG domain
VVFNLVNASVISAIVAPVMGLTPLNMLRTNLSGIYVQMLTLPTFGAIVPVIAQEHIAALLVIVIPLIGPFLSFRGFERTRQAIQETMAGLADALERRDPYTHQHSMRVTDYVGEVLTQLNVPYETSQGILAAARIHDIGKVAIPDHVLNKPSALTKEEFEEIQSHAAVGAEMVEKLWMYRPWVPVIHHHHERWDGKGYPDGIAGEEIPLGARIIAVADAYDAMTTDRVYRKAFPVEKALTELREQKGIQFDPEIVDALCRALGFPEESAPAVVVPGPELDDQGPQQPAAMIMKPPKIVPQN